MRPIGIISTLKANITCLSCDTQFDVKYKQSIMPLGVEMIIVDNDEQKLPRNSVNAGRRLVRGLWPVAVYFKGNGGDFLNAGSWFDIGDVANIDECGYELITDRAKEVIKSGGEWISVIDTETYHRRTSSCCGGSGNQCRARVGRTSAVNHIAVDGETLDEEMVLAFLKDTIAK